MKIIQIVPGFGGTFYCGNCLRDSALVKSLRHEGHDALTVPMYLPLSLDGETHPDGIPVFYGAVNLYLKQHFRWLRNMPEFMERLLNSGPVLNFAAHKAGSTRAEGLEEMTESMLLGSEGNQWKELEVLVEFLKKEQPDVVHLSNALLLGLAGRIREEIQVPVIFSLQDEDVWVDAMRDEYRERIWELMAEKGKDVDGFIAVSHFYAGVMQQRMKIPAEKLHTVHIGVNPAAYEPSTPASNPLTIGFLSRMNEENGFGLLVDAFIELKKNRSFESVRLSATGGLTGDDKPYIREQVRKLKQANLADQVDIDYDFQQEKLTEFFQNISLLSVPVLKGEAFGLYQLEALASGVPLVQPALGAFPEIIEATGGGVIYHPNTPDALAAKLAEVLETPSQLEKMSLNGIEAVTQHFDCGKLTLQLVGIYEQIIESKR
ncbi:MAG: glycosyltransferase family 4 protein [Bacteroidales bacterium]|nr:glycosyltransferase family 4 protein [Bacteroidales bacterium]